MCRWVARWCSLTQAQLIPARFSIRAPCVAGEVVQRVNSAMATQHDVGDDETPASVGDVPVGGSVVQVSGGQSHTCAVLDTGNVRCWGEGLFGRLGYGNENRIGDNETPASVGDVPVGGSVVQVSAGSVHTCALLETGNVRCWGAAGSGELGYGNHNQNRGRRRTSQRGRCAGRRLGRSSGDGRLSHLRLAQHGQRALLGP